jgi:hypothetical protein
MKKWYCRVRYYALALTAGGLFFLGGCGLSDQQLASIWESVISSGLSAVVGNAIQTAVGTTTPTA